MHTLKTTTVATALICLILATSAQAESWALVDDFQSHVLGTEPSSANGWTERGGEADDLIVDEDGNQVMQLLGSANIGYNIALGDNTILDNTTGTIFFRTRSETAANFMMGVAATDWDWPAGINWWDHDDVGFYSASSVGDGTAMRPHYDSGNVQDIEGATWYNVWMVADNTAKTYDFYISQGLDGATGGATSVTVDTGVPFRNATGDLAYFMFWGTSAYENLGGRLDDIYIDPTGENLSLVPEPGTLLLLLSGLAGLLLWRRRM